MRWVLKKVPSPCAVLADPAKLSRRRSRLGLRMRLGASRTCRRPAPSGHPPRLPSARPRRAAHPLPRCARSRHGRRPPRSPPLRVAGAQPRAGHLRIHHGEANGPKREEKGRASGSNSLLVSRAAAAPFIRPLVMSFRFSFCIVSRPLASQGAPERHVYCCWLRARNGLFLTRNQVYYIRTPSGGTLGACATRQGGVGGGRASSPDRLAAESRGEARRAATLESRRDGRGARPTLMPSKVQCAIVL